MTRCPTCGHPVHTVFEHIAIDCNSDMTAAQIAKLLAWEEEGFPIPKPNPDGTPCGECHIRQGETCDVCLAVGR